MMLKMCSRMLAIIFAITMVWAGSAMALSISFDDGDNGTDVFTVTDNDSNDQSDLDGQVIYTGSIGQWKVNSLTGTSAPMWGTNEKPMLDMMSLTLSSTVGGIIAVTVEDTYASFDNLDSTIKGFEASIGGTTSGVVNFYAYINGTLIDISWADDMTHNGSSFSGAESLLMADIDTGDPFTLSMKAVITQGTWSITTFDAQIAPVPEPATMILFGIGLIGIAGVTRKKLNLKRPE